MLLPISRILAMTYQQFSPAIEWVVQSLSTSEGVIGMTSVVLCVVSASFDHISSAASKVVGHWHAGVDGI